MSGEVSEWFMELVLKTSDAARHRGFESLSLRQFFNSILSWRSTQVAVRGSPAKGVGSAKGREGSNPSFSAIMPPQLCRLRWFFYAIESLEQFETSPLSCFSTGVIRCGEFLHTSRDNGAVQKFGWQVQAINDKSEYIILTY